MKVKDYVEIYREREKQTDIVKAETAVGFLFISELGDIIEKRNCQTNRACLAAVKEQDLKWRKFVKTCKIDNITFQDIFRIFMKELYVELSKSSSAFEELGWR